MCAGGERIVKVLTRVRVEVREAVLGDKMFGYLPDLTEGGASPQEPEMVLMVRKEGANQRIQTSSILYHYKKILLSTGQCQ